MFTVILNPNEADSAVQHNKKSLSFNHYCSGKAIHNTYSECVFVALGTQHPMRMRRIMLLSVTCPALQDVSTESHKRHDFGKMLLGPKCVF
jgi:hypothetical protein